MSDLPSRDEARKLTIDSPHWGLSSKGPSDLVLAAYAEGRSVRGLVCQVTPARI